MKYIELVKRVDGQELLVAGYLTAEEIQLLYAEGYRKHLYNKHGILVSYGGNVSEKNKIRE